MSGFAIEVGKKIRQHRKAANLTQEKLAEILSTDPSYIGKMERGEVNITLGTISNIAEALRVSPYDFFEITKTNNNAQKNDLIEKLNVMILSLHTEDLKVVYRIIKEAITLIKK